MAKENEKLEPEVKVDDATVRFNEAERAPAVSKLTSLLKNSGTDEKSALMFSSLFCKETSKILFEEVVKKFEDKPDTKSHLGTTEKSDGIEDTHTFATLGLDWGEQIVGVTTGTKGAKDHVHMINIYTDWKIRSMVADTDLAEMPNAKPDEMSYHRHIFALDLDALKKHNPSIFTCSMYYSEKKDPTDVGRQGFSNVRQAEALLAQVCQLSDAANWFKGDLKEIQQKIYKAVFEQYPEGQIFQDTLCSRNWLSSFRKCE